MYAALWHKLPGPWWVKTLILVILAAVVLVVCFNWFFPWVSDYMPFNEQTVEAQAAGLGLLSMH